MENHQASMTFNSDDLLSRHLKTVPAFRALLRATEARLLSTLELAEPVLDLGCGDGNFAKMAFSEPIAVGVDPWWSPVQKAQASGAYRLAIQSSGMALPFTEGCFGTVISNSVLEHIEDVLAVLHETNRVLRPGGRLILTVPSHLFTEWLGGASVLSALGFEGPANGYRRLFNLVSRHCHTDPPNIWSVRLSRAGFSIDRWQYYFSKDALRTLELGHIQGLPSAIMHLLTGHWIIAPWTGNLRYTERWIRPYYEEEPGRRGAYLLFVAQKQSDQPIDADLPLANPLPLTEPVARMRKKLEQKEVHDTASPLVTRDHSTRDNRLEDYSQGAEPVPQEELGRGIAKTDAASPAKRLRLASVVLMTMVLLFALVAQSILASTPADPSVGVGWYAYSIVAFLVLAWRKKGWTSFGSARWRRVRFSIGTIPRRRWMCVMALLVSLMAHRAANNATGPGNPLLAFMLWATAMMMSGYALWNAGTIPIRLPDTRRSRANLTATVLLFLVALGLRAVDLTEHPFILNGVESSIGLDALAVTRGAISSPFSTGWLTNPTMPLFLVAVPLRFFGPSVLGIRLISPLVGAITVVATFLVGSRLWGRTVGLLAAVLLAGSHLHLHYSRLGMTNIWDPLLVLIALGAVGAAWQSPEDAISRPKWLLAGGLIGLNAYFFTSSRLLPLILVGLFLYAVSFDRLRLQQRWREILAAAIMALVVALPQLLYYQANPTVYLERANTLGILDSQSSWLAQEAGRTGKSQVEVLAQQLWLSLLAFNYTLDKSTAYRPQVPMLGFGAAMLFVIGTTITLLQIRRFANGILLIWILVTVVFAGALLIESPSSQRLVVVAPALCLMAAIALVELGNNVLGLYSSGVLIVASPKTTQRYLVSGLIIIAALISLNDVLFYFGRYRSQHLFGDRNTEIANGLADYLNSLDGDWTAYFHGPPSMYVGFPTIPFLTEGFAAGVNLHDVEMPDSQLQPALGQNIVHIYLPERAAELETMRILYPDGVLKAPAGFFANPLFYAYETRGAKNE